MHIPTGEMLLRLLVAASLASGLGLERELHRRGAGLRTHALVGLAACLFTIASAFGFGDSLGPHVTLDPSRVAAQVASGIGFIGAGAIIMRKQVVHGLTTAASIWIAAALGVAAGCGLYLPAFGTAVIALLFLSVIRLLEKRLEKQRRKPTIVAIFDAAIVSLASIIANVEAAGVQPSRISLIAGDKEGKHRAQISLSKEDRRKLENAIQQLALLPGVHEANASL
jgi:putative Mg2+ transporter-C (MgtC) family protein